jgi:hypothetical protein
VNWPIIVGGPLWLVMPGDTRGIALFPFIFLRQGQPTDALLRHERIHLRQQAELLVLPFYLWYLLDYARHRLRGLSRKDAYLAICFEREAYAHDQEAGYLNRRPRWAFVEYCGS